MDIKISEYQHCYLVQLNGEQKSSNTPQLIQSLENIMSGALIHQSPGELKVQGIYSYRESLPAEKQMLDLDQKIPSKCYRIALDMSEVSFASSAFLRMIVSTQDKCKRYNRGDLVLAHMQPNIWSAFDLAGFTSRFKIYTTTLDAVGNF
jgi:anti-anti-sigma factor